MGKNRSETFMLTCNAKGKENYPPLTRPCKGGMVGLSGDKWLRVDFSVAAELTDAVSHFMMEIGAEGVYQETLAATFSEHEELNRPESLTGYLPWDKKEAAIVSLRTYLDRLHLIFPDSDKTNFTIKEITSPDWGQEWKKYFHPLRIGKRFIIKPTWEPYEPADGDIVIEIDPGMAFGTGQHQSTSMCLEAIEGIFSKNDASGWKVLDVGAGTGILGIAAAKLGAKQVLCVDIDERAVEIAQSNAILNQVQKRLVIRSREIRSLRRRFNLIAANLTEKLLVEICADLQRFLAPCGYLVISGIIEQNSREIEERFFQSPLCLYQKIKRAEWLCYVFCRE